MVFTKKELNKRYYEKNKAILLTRNKNYAKQYRLESHNLTMIYKWKKRGLIANDYPSIYYRWLNSKKCEKCGHDYSYWRKEMDHCHKTGKFRNIVCHNCNANDREDNSTGYPNIYFNKPAKLWLYSKIYYKKSHCKYFKTKNQAIIYKWFYELGYTIETSEN